MNFLSLIWYIWIFIDLMIDTLFGFFRHIVCMSLTKSNIYLVRKCFPVGSLRSSHK